MLTALLRYPSTDVLLKIDDYIFVEYLIFLNLNILLFYRFFLEKISFTIDSEIYIFPFLDLIREDYSSNIRYNNQENVVINHEKHCLTYKSDFDIKNDSILSKFHSMFFKDI